MSRIARNSVNGRLNRNTFCSGAEVLPVHCKQGVFNASLYLKVASIRENTVPKS